MTPAPIRSTVVTERAAWVREMVFRAKTLPLASLEVFLADPRNAGAAESFLRRGLEALLDLGRHILAKGFGVAPGEYKEIAIRLVQHGVLERREGLLMRRIAGYRNRMVHFYHEVTAEELYRLCTQELSDIETLCDTLLAWLRKNPAKMDRSL